MYGYRRSWWLELGAAHYLILANLIGFALQLFFPRLTWEFALTPAAVTQKLYIWQLVTSMFLHGGLWHILFNMLALWMFGLDLERVWGARRFLYYYFFTGIGAGLLYVLVNPFSWVPSIGASGAIYGVLLAFALLFPHRTIFLYFFPLPARYAVIVMGLLAFFASVGGYQAGINHVAHLGGLLFGLLYLKGRGWLYRLTRR